MTTPTPEFIELMRRDGWRPFATNAGNGIMTFYHGDTVYFADGEIIKNGKRQANCGDWREWLEAGQTPPPF